MYRVTMSAPRLVYAAPVSEAAAQWGVYAIPKLWRLPCGELVVYANGKKDTPGSPRLCPDLFFLSGDGGETWTPAPKREDINTDILGNVEFPCLRLASGGTLCLEPAARPAPIVGIEPVNRFPIPNAPDDLYYT